MRVFFAENCIDEAKEFDAHYASWIGIHMPDKKPSGRKPKHERTCRFCKKSFPEVTFKNDPHIISRLLGNKHLISDFECDTCNLRFGLFESNLASFLGIQRTLTGVDSESKTPIFTSKDGRLKAKKEDFYGIKNAVVVSALNKNDSPFLGHPVAGQFMMELEKQPYKPIYVYKAFLKMALSCLPETAIPNYQQALDFLLSNDSELAEPRYLIVRNYICPNIKGYDEPNCFLFKKRDAKASIPFHIFMLNFKNQIFEIAIPLYKKSQGDSEVFFSNGIWCPPFFANPEHAESTVIWRDLDLSSAVDVKGEKERMIFHIPYNIRKDLIAMGPKTGKLQSATDINDGISKIIFVPAGISLNGFPISKI